MKTIPKTMRAATIDRFGPPEVLTIRELPLPTVVIAEKGVPLVHRCQLAALSDRDF